MASSVPSSMAPCPLPGCPVGANPIIWSNDDFADLSGDVALEVILRETRAAGYAGTELGHAFPREIAPLHDVLRRHDLRLASGWHSTLLAVRAYEDEAKEYLRHVDLLRTLGARVIIVAECSHSIHGDRTIPLGFGDTDRPRLNAAEWARVVAGLERFVGIAEAQGMRVAYHHHMGTVIQTAEELDRLLAAVPGLTMLLDPGHLAFAGIDPLEAMLRHGARVSHVHLKSVRTEVVGRARAERWSFYRAVSEGVFTVPGDGGVSFVPLFQELGRRNYSGWLIVEAEEDPAKVPALPKAIRARDYVRNTTGA